METGPRPLNVLLVENSHTHIALTRRALSSAGVPPRVVVATGQSSAMRAMLHQRVDLVILDLDLGQGSGLALLAEIKRTPSTRGTPVVIVSGHDEPDLVAAAYREQAAGFIKKPRSFAQYERALQRLIHFWMQARVA